ncbi:MAG TPA: ATP-binding protein [Bacteroidia bacterium]|jgi:signal transduction histidine kinase|nr:ATP-binding protein [Bacteroidia bacterium]
MKLEANIEDLLLEIAELKKQLFESSSILDAIKEGEIDALVLNKDGKHNIYSLESADFTYRLLIEKFSEGALSITDTGLILFCNKYFSKLVETEADKIIGTYFMSFIDSVGQFQDLMTQLKDGQSKGEITLNIEGRKVPVFISLTDLRPQVNAIGVVVTDLTEKRKHEEAIVLYQRELEMKISELNGSNEYLEQFIHVISHDIKEPLRKIVSYSSLLHSNEDKHLDEDETRNLKIIATSAIRLTSLVDDLVKYALNSRKVEVAEIDLNVVVKEVMEDLEVLIKEKDAVVEIKKLPQIMGSQVQMRQVFSNLITNAIKYKKKHLKPIISIASEVTDCVDSHFPNKKYYKVSIGDNGIGIQQNKLKKIFVIFQRLHMPGEYTGNGIGLAICKRIMESHLGKIEAVSSENEGSTFNIYFPVNIC